MPEKKSLLLRISPELWAELNRWAADELRSVNGQIEYVLRQAVAERRWGGKGLERGSAGAVEALPTQADDQKQGGQDG